MPKKIVLAYSGGLDTSVILIMASIKYQCPVVTFTADLGQGEELEPVRGKAESLGIKKYTLKIFKKNCLRAMYFLCLGLMLYMKVLIYLVQQLQDL